MARALIRTSINGPSPNNQQHQLRGALERVGFVRIGTGAYEGVFETQIEAYDAVQVVLDFLRAMPAQFGIDHFWMYIDNADWR